MKHSRIGDGRGCRSTRGVRASAAWFAVLLAGAAAMALADDGPAPPGNGGPAVPGQPAPPAPAGPVVNPLPPDPLRDASRKIREGNLDAALAIVEPIATADAANFDANLLYVEILVRRKETGSRVEVIRKRAADRADDPFAAYLAARLFPAKEQGGEFQRLEQKFPTSPWPHAGRARVLESMGKLKEALKEHDLAVTASSDNPRFRAARARACELAERWSDAVTDWKMVLIAFPNDVTALLGYGEALRQTGDVDTAVVQFDLASKLVPTEVEPRYRLGLAHADAKRYVEALASFDQALAIDPKSCDVLCAASTAALRRASLDAVVAKRPVTVKDLAPAVTYADRAIAAAGDLPTGYIVRAVARETAAVGLAEAEALAAANPPAAAPAVPANPDTPVPPGGDAPKAPGGDAPKAPGGDAPKAPGGDAPKAPGGDAPKAPGGDAPKVPGGDAPKAPGGDAPKAPGGDAPKVPGGDAPAPAPVADTVASLLKLAVDDYGAAITRNPIPGPGLVRALVGRSHVNFLLEAYDDAAADALRAADISPTEEAAWGNAGDALTLGGKGEDAVKKAWRPGIKAIPNSARLHHGLGMTLWKLGAKGSDALNELKEAAKLAPSEGRYRLSFGEALYQAYREKEALPELLQATGLRDKDRESWASLAHTYVALHRWQEAADAYEKVCEVDPKAVEEHIYLAIIYSDRLKMKDKGQAHARIYTDRGGADPLLAGWIEALMTGK